MNVATQSRLTDIGLLLLRAVLGVVFIYHGGQKLFGLFGGPGLTATAGWMASIGIPVPLLNATLAGSAEFFGGIVLLLGTGARLAAIPMAFTMLVAIVSAHRGAFGAQAGGMEYPLTLGVALVALALIGPGRLTVARLIHALRPSPAVRPARTIQRSPRPEDSRAALTAASAQG